METRRYINVRTWSETWFEDLSATDKLVWIYLNTNSSTNMLGAYNTSIRRLAYECHISEPAVRRSIKKLEVIKKVIYHEGYVIIIDWMAQQSMNPSMKIAARKEYDKLPEQIRLLLSEQTHRDIEKTRQLPEQDASRLPAPNGVPQGEKEEEKEYYEQEHKEEHRISEEKHGMAEEKHRMPEEEQKTGNPEEESTVIPTRKAFLKAVQNKEWLKTLCQNHHLKQPELEKWLEHFCRKLQNEGESRKSVRDFRRHFASWLDIQLNSSNHSKDHYHDNYHANNETATATNGHFTTDINPLLQSEAEQRFEQLRATGTLPTLPDTE